MQDILSTIWGMSISSWWIWKALSHAAVFGLLGKLVSDCLREHSYLLHAKDKDDLLEQVAHIIEPTIAKLTITRYRMLVETDLRRAGLESGATANHFIAKQIVIFGATLIGALLLLNLLFGLSLIVCMLLAAIVGLLPFLKLHDVAALRFRSSSKDLPFFVDYLALSMDAGLDFNQGVATVIADAPKSPIVDEFSRLLRNMKLGMSREDGLKELQRRLDSPGIRIFTQTLTQAIKIGTDVVQTLHVMSETMRTNRFQRAEEQAGKISVRMMIPMMVFILPATVIMLLGPIVLEWMIRM